MEEGGSEGKQDIPNGIMRSIHFNDIPRQSQRSGTHLVGAHDSPKIRHCFRIGVCISDCGERVRSAFVLRNGDNICPVWVV